MRKNLFFGIVLMVLLVVMLFNGIPVKAQWDGTIKIGVVGPRAWTQGVGLVQGANLAAEQINLGPNGVDDGGDGDDGIVIGGLNYEIAIVTADTLRGMPSPTSTSGATAASELVAAGCDFVIGGFKAEAIYGIREILMDYKKIYFIAGGLLGGAALNELVWDPTKPDNIYDNYARYKYTFRNAPINVTQQLWTLANYLKWLMINRLTYMYGAPVKIAIISEYDISTDMLHAFLSNEFFWTYPVDIVYTARPAPFAKNFTLELAGVKASGAQLVIHLFWTPSGRTFITQWSSMGVKALPVGISEAALFPIYWGFTDGKCEYETVLAVTGTQTPITPRTLAYWNTYLDEYGHAPIHTSYAAYDAVVAIEQMLVLGPDFVDGTADDPTSWPMSSDALVPMFEQRVADGSANAWDYNLGAMAPNTGLTGKFKYTGENGTRHDVYSKEHGWLIWFGTMDSNGPFWVNGWTRTLVGQWQYNPLYGTGRLEVVFPLDKAYSLKTKIPPRAYLRAEVDLAPGDGTIGLADMAVIASTWISSPGDANWITGGTFLGLYADMDDDKRITIFEASIVARDFGQAAGPLDP